MEQFSLVATTVAPREPTAGSGRRRAQPLTPDSRTWAADDSASERPFVLRQAPPRDQGEPPASAAGHGELRRSHGAARRRAGRPRGTSPARRSPGVVGSRRPAAHDERVDVPQHRCRGVTASRRHAGNAPGQRLLDRRAHGLALEASAGCRYESAMVVASRTADLDGRAPANRLSARATGSQRSRSS